MSVRLNGRSRPDGRGDGVRRSATVDEPGRRAGASTKPWDHPIHAIAEALGPVGQTPGSGHLSGYDDQQVTALDLLLRADGQAVDRAADRTGDGGFHLHRLDRGDGTTDADLLADLDRE